MVLIWVLTWALRRYRRATSVAYLFHAFRQTTGRSERDVFGNRLVGVDPRGDQRGVCQRLRRRTAWGRHGRRRLAGCSEKNKKLLTVVRRSHFHSIGRNGCDRVAVDPVPFVHGEHALVSLFEYREGVGGADAGADKLERRWRDFGQ